MEGGRILFFTGADGAFALDLRTRKSRRLTRPTFADCTKNEIQARDVVRELSSDGVLLVERGCGYQWDWHGQGMRLRNQPEHRTVIGQEEMRSDTALIRRGIRVALAELVPFVVRRPARREVNHDRAHVGDVVSELPCRPTSHAHRAYLATLLKWADGNISKAARKAGMDRMYLHRLVQRHGLRSGV